MSEVRAALMPPRELRERRDACPVAWLPLGTLEWHGRHLPLGTDGIIAESSCIAAAEAIGGVAFPAQYYADHRGAIMEALYAAGVHTYQATFDHRLDCCRELGVSVAGVEANAMRDQRAGAGGQHAALLERNYWMLRAYGFTRIVAVAGHGPNRRPAEIAADRFHARQSTCQVICGDIFSLAGSAGDHAGAAETSQILFFQPQLVDLERLTGDRPEEPTGIAGEHPRHASADRGRKILEAFITGCRERLGEVPASQPLRDPDEDGVQAAWLDVLRTSGIVSLWPSA